MRARAAVGLLLILMLAAAACGGGLSKGELVAEGDKIRKRINDAIAKEPEPVNAEDLQRLAKRTVELSDPAIKDMEELEPPDDLKTEFADFVKSLKRQRDLTAQIGDAAGEGDTARIEKLGAQAQSAQADYRKVSGEIGFKECGGGS